MLQCQNFKIYFTVGCHPKNSLEGIHRNCYREQGDRHKSCFKVQEGHLKSYFKVRGDRNNCCWTVQDRFPSKNFRGNNLRSFSEEGYQKHKQCKLVIFQQFKVSHPVKETLTINLQATKHNLNCSSYPS